MILDISNELMDTGRSKQYTVSYESDTFHTGTEISEWFRQNRLNLEL